MVREEQTGSVITWQLDKFAVSTNSLGGLPTPKYHDMVYGVASGENQKNSLIQPASFPYGNDDTSREVSLEYLTNSKYDSGRATPSKFFVLA